MREWLLLDGDRFVVAGLTVLAFLASVVALELAGLVPVRHTQPVFYAFGALISGNLTLVTVVVSINQLLLSRELKSPGELESQIDSVIDYRTGVEEAADRVAPVQPLGFLRLLFENTRQQAQRIAGLAINTADEGATDEIDDLVTTLTAHLDEVVDILEGSEASTFHVLSVTLTTNYANQINHARRIRSRYGDGLTDGEMERLDDLIDRLQEIDVARQYFKSIYLQEELSSLSRVLLYAGLPAEAVAFAALLSFTAPAGSTILMRHPDVVVPLAAAVSFLPLALLFSFIVRASTVTQRTVATIPFTTPEQEM